MKRLLFCAIAFEQVREMLCEMIRKESALANGLLVIVCVFRCYFALYSCEGKRKDVFKIADSFLFYCTLV